MGIVDIVGRDIYPAAGREAVGHTVHPIVALSLHHGGDLLIGVRMGADGHSVEHLPNAHVHIGRFHREALHVAHHFAVHILFVVGHPRQVVVISIHNLCHSNNSFLFHDFPKQGQHSGSAIPHMNN